ncbi:glycosyltransferase [Mesorhizobium dulcispinae]|uniref:glycosyltransferase n=1 Tax=Mesorhizobium dulcispinae TaxID=3072316 RepID=UPI002A23D2A4|nr:glycosyltransferase [Mesorhizobium sp. VK23D]MDX8520883.1 glycosyltransferase [Mesorhizobium sp. VK23D]
MPAKIAVIYLARLHEGFQSFEAFAETYRKHPAGQEHDLVIICKGFEKPGEFAAIGAIFTGIRHKIISMPDDIGLDINAYREAALRIGNEFVCCLNTFTLLRTDNWLAKLWANLSKPGIGMVGATGSFESLFTSYKVINFLAWAASQPTARFDRASTQQFGWLLNQFAPHTMRAAKSKRYRIRRLLGDILRNRSSMARLQGQMSQTWADVLGYNGGLREFRDVPQFPNPHIRSNVFMMRRLDMLSVPMEGTSKYACCRFESGPDSLSISMLSKGLDLVVVGADGIGYRMDQWPTCGGFRSGDQSNLLASDNQTRAYELLTDGEKRTHQTMTWGGYSRDPRLDTKLLGVSFERKAPLSERIENFMAPKKLGRERLISIAIPTHDRLDLVLDAIKTITHQNYDNWEICVFDNASKNPISPAIAALGDPRIQVKRSEKFLPVTESWNGAIDMTKGEFVTMIGDDDGIAPGFFQRINYLADRFDSPDLIFSNLYQFMHPGVVPGKRQGYVAGLQMADFFEDRDYPFVLDPKEVRRSVDNSLRMRRSFMFNMPAFCCSRDLLERMRIDGRVMLSPFPDYYFANLALHLAKKVVGEPRPLAFQGVSKVSFGFTLMNAKLDDGFKVLNHDVANDDIYREVSKRLLPASRYHSEYIVTMAYVARVIGDKARQPDFKHYRHVQMWQYLKSHKSLFRWPRTEKGREMWNMLAPDEKRWMLRANLVRKLSTRFPRFWEPAAQRLDQESSAYLFEAKQIIYRLGEHVTLFDVYKELDSGPFSATIESKNPGRKTAKSSRKRSKTAPADVLPAADQHLSREQTNGSAERPRRL